MMTGSLRSGYTTGTCAAAAAKAAVQLLVDGIQKEDVEVGLPDGERVHLPVSLATLQGGVGMAAVYKDAGDDPDITQGVLVKASVSFIEGKDILFEAGEGVGKITKPGLQLPVGESAINPVPREQIRRAVREITDQGLRIMISIPGGEALAAKTFNPRLGIMGGLSILGTQGRVRPFSCSALRESLKSVLNVAWAAGIRTPIFVPGHIGARAALKHFSIFSDQIIEVGNEWGFILDEAASLGFKDVLVLGHPGKLAKLAAGDWDTHSSRSRSALPFISQMTMECLGRDFSDVPTVEGIFTLLPEIHRRHLGNLVTGRIREAITDRLGGAAVTVILVDMKGNILGAAGDIAPWQM